MKVYRALAALIALVFAIAPIQAATIYVTGNSSQFGSFDTDTLVYTEISTSLGGQTSGLAHHNGQFYGILDNSSLRTISTTGVVAVIGGTNSRSAGLASDGTTLFNMFFSTTATDRLQTVNPADGTRTNLSGSDPVLAEIGGRIAFKGSTLYGTFDVTGGSGDGLYSLNTTTGAPTFVGNGGAAGTYTNMFAAFSSGGTLYGISVTTLYSINTTNGNLTLVGNLTGTNLPGFFLGAGEVVVAAPEPSGLAVAALGMAGLGSTARRARRKRSD